MAFSCGGSASPTSPVPCPRKSEAGFTVLEVFLALVILGVVGLALHNVMLSGLNQIQLSREHAAQAKALEAAVDWARARPCALFGGLSGTNDEYKIDLSGDMIGTFRRIDPAQIDQGSELPDSVWLIEVELSGAKRTPDHTHRFLLGVGSCGQP